VCPTPTQVVGVSAYPGVSMALASPDGVLITTAEAAKRCGVKPGTIRQWVARGHLTPAGRLPAGRSAMFRLADVAARARADQPLDLDALNAELLRYAA
jgi:excisionase family DNA binding protein